MNSACFGILSPVRVRSATQLHPFRIALSLRRIALEEVLHLEFLIRTGTN